MRSEEGTETADFRLSSRRTAELPIAGSRTAIPPCPCHTPFLPAPKS